jgi:DNA polymerase III delta subunit
MKNKKITPQEALTLLEKHFKTDLLSIYQEINKFREGIKSLEVYTS